ncbi:MAG: hypothetical protein U9Q06_03740 [Nanoarchaeota archaeon]|nr:hypothetical protein [Nanoarchaeota archaeon]
MRLFKKRQRTIDFTKMSIATPIKRDFKMSGDTVDLRGQNVQPKEGGDVNLAGSGNSGDIDLGVNPLAQPQSNGNSVMDFLSSSSSSLQSSSATSSNPVTQISEVSELKNKMRSMTNKVENTENDIYRLMQKLELLERKIERLGG